MQEGGFEDARAMQWIAYKRSGSQATERTDERASGRRAGGQAGGPAGAEEKTQNATTRTAGAKELLEKSSNNTTERRITPSRGLLVHQVTANA